MNYVEIMRQMVDENKSIREMAKILGIPKSTLHYRLDKCKDRIRDDFLVTDFQILMTKNKNEMAKKGGLNRWEKK